MPKIPLIDPTELLKWLETKKLSCLEASNNLNLSPQTRSEFRVVAFTYDEVIKRIEGNS